MMKKRKVSLATVSIFLLVLLLVGCSAMKHEDQAISEEVDYSQGTGAAPAGGEAGEGAGYSSDAADIPSIRKIIVDVRLSLNVKDVEQALDMIKQRTESLKGYIANSNSHKDKNERLYSYIEVKIPSKELDVFLEFVHGLGDVKDENRQTQDITEDYYDVQARLKHAKAQEQQLLEIMEQAKTIDEILKVQKSIDEVQERIEQLQGKIKLWDQLVDMSSVAIDIQMDTKLVEEDGQDIKIMSFKEVGTGIKNGLVTTAKHTVNVLGYIVIGIFYLLIPAAIAVAVFLIIKLIKRWKGHRSKTN
ncbi:MAG: DUF4349 domain-containing protein [Mahellales bacterium]